MTEPERLVDAVDALIDSKLIEGLDFEVTCESRLVQIRGGEPAGEYRTCVRTAVGMIRCRHCGQEWMVCAEHRDEILAARRLQCLVCKVIGPGNDLFSYVAMVSS